MEIAQDTIMKALKRKDLRHFHTTSLRKGKKALMLWCEINADPINRAH
jgi:hypothetical protein